jgi:hypothetical protein
VLVKYKGMDEKGGVCLGAPAISMLRHKTMSEN